MTEGLAPCPICASTDVGSRFDNGTFKRRSVCVVCHSCGSRGPDVEFDEAADAVTSETMAVAGWNTREAQRAVG